MTWNKHDDAVYWFDLTIAQDKGLVFWQTMFNAITLNNSMQADCLIRVVSNTNEIFYHKKKLEPQIAPKSHSGLTLHIHHKFQT